ncbi:MAG: glycosyltransferase [Gammaproteobacteria bacterium]
MAAAKDMVVNAREDNAAREFISILFARRRLICGVFLAFSLVTLLVMLLAPSIYVVESELVVLSKKVVQNPETGTSPAEFLPPAPEDLHTEINILVSPALVRETVATLHAQGVFDGNGAPAGGDARDRTRLQSVSDRIEHWRAAVRNWTSQQLRTLWRGVTGFVGGASSGNSSKSGANAVAGHRDAPVLDELATRASENLQAEIVPGSNVMHLSYTHKDPRVGHVLLNRLVQNYLQRRRALLLNEGSSAYFAQKRRAYKRRLQRLSQAKLALLRNGQTADPQGELSQSLDMVSDETRRLYALQDRYAKARQWLDYVKAKLHDLDASGDLATFTLPRPLHNPELLAQQQRVARVHQTYVRAAQVYVPESRRISALAQRLEAARQGLRELIANRVAEGDARASILGTAVREARQRIDDLRSRAQALEQLRAQVEQLNTEMRVVRQAYLDFSRRLERARAEESTDIGQISNVQVLNRATVPLQPAFPNAKAIVPVGLLAAILLGLMVGYLREYFDRTFRRPDHITAHLGLPVIASILRDNQVAHGMREPVTPDNAAPVPDPSEAKHIRLKAYASGGKADHADSDARPVRRILHLLSPDGIYGAERVLFNQMHVLSGMGFAIAYFNKTSAGQQDFLEAARAHGCTLFPIEDRLTRVARSLREIRAAMHASRAEVLHCHGYKATVFGLAAATRFGLPVVVTQHGIIEGRAKLRLYNFLDKLACRFSRAAQVICVSPEIYHKYRRFGVPERRLHVLPNAIRVPERLAEHNGEDRLALAQFAPGERRLFVLYVGRLSDEKGPDLFLDMIARLRQSHTNVLGVVVGDGPMRVSLLDRAKALNLYNHIRFTGFRKDADALIAHADLVVVPSRSEGLPMVLLEAMAAGAPVVATAVGGVPQVLKNGETGLMVAPGDSAALAEAAGTLLTSAHQRERLRRRAWAFVREHHSLQEQAKVMARLYAQAVAQPKGSAPQRGA